MWQEKNTLLCMCMATHPAVFDMHYAPAMISHLKEEALPYLSLLKIFLVSTFTFMDLTYAFVQSYLSYNKYEIVTFILFNLAGVFLQFLDIQACLPAYLQKYCTPFN